MNKLLKGRIVEKFGTQFEFSRTIGEHEAVVSKVIRGHIILDPYKKKRWAAALNIDDYDGLFEGQGVR